MKIKVLCFPWQVVDFLQPYFRHSKCKQCRYKSIIKYTELFSFDLYLINVPFAVSNFVETLVHSSKLNKIERGSILRMKIKIDELKLRLK